ncbi:chorismate mutase [Terasakiella pusilla]|jgi:isochorismate pyruvate lyase|uniref:chorismate mutase n=1 Tax=Terasakiella pusilla TaxID=64973 RepID=UPI00048CC5D3|nr:chorismate mutase [Terasakiella pusilla]
MPKAVKCNSLQEVRDNIDRLDEIIIPLLAERIGYVLQAAQFKETRGDVRIPSRIQFIVDRVRVFAEKEGMDPDMAESIYRHIMEESIAREEIRWDDINE